MKNDMNPSIIMFPFMNVNALFNGRFERFVKEANKYGIKIRMTIPLDVSIPLQPELYDDAVNFLKENMCPMLSHFFTKDFMGKKMLTNHAEKKLKLREFDYETFNKDFITSTNWKYGFLGLAPFMVDIKRLDNAEGFLTDDEVKNYHKLISLSSEGYKPNKQSIAKNQKDDVGNFKTSKKPQRKK